jgi:hypothetical protein
MRVLVCHREDQELYHQKIALQLGGHDQMLWLSEEETAAGKTLLKSSALVKKNCPYWATNFGAVTNKPAQCFSQGFRRLSIV